MALLEVRNVSKIYGAQTAPVTALENVSLTADPGSVVALVGRSGCGKSTLLNLCGAMDFPSSGQVLIAGDDTSRLSDTALTRLRREKIGFVFQSFQLLHTLTAAANVELPLLLARRKDFRKIAAERLRWVEMLSFADRYPHQLSGGEQQRVAIARALAQNPPLLLADEPTGNLDTATGEMVLRLLRRTASEFSLAVILATHNPETLALADRVIQLRDGRMVPNIDPQ
jgi:putative ABC transport system ATP-binding protein